MKLLAYARLLNSKIKSANNMAQNPFINKTYFPNPFNRPIYNTLVWVEPDEKKENNN